MNSSAVRKRNSRPFSKKNEINGDCYLTTGVNDAFLKVAFRLQLCEKRSA